VCLKKKKKKKEQKERKETHLSMIYLLNLLDGRAQVAKREIHSFHDQLLT
jgi:hypothetical protein